MNVLLYGLVTGLFFGFLMQRAGVLRYEKQLGALRLFDMTIVKFALSVVVVGMLGVHLLLSLNVIDGLSVKPTHVGGNIIGGLIFGIGWGVLGLCPGTAVGAAGEGRWHALWGILGMLAGAALYAEAYPLMKRKVLTLGNLGEITLPGALGVSPWVLIPVFVTLTLVLFVWFEKKRL